MFDTDQTGPKVLLLSNRFQVRGSSLYTLRLAEAFLGYQLRTAIVTADAGSVEPVHRARLRFAEYPHLRTPIWGRVVQRLMLEELKKDRPDLIHVQAHSMLPLGGWLARRLGVPFVVTMHDYLRSRDSFAFDRKQGRRIIAVSDSVRAELRDKTKLPEDLFVVIPTGIQPRPEIKAACVPVLDPGHIPVVGTAGRLEAIKGIQYFLSAAQEVVRSGREAEFLVAGAGPEEVHLRKLANELKIADRVTFITNLHEFSVALAATDIFCLPSLQQGLGTVMMEAMALGKPVIASKVGGITSVIDDAETGVLVPPADPVKLAYKIGELLSAPMRARELGEAGRQKVLSEYRLETTVAATLALYCEILGLDEIKPRVADVAEAPAASAH